MGVGLLIAPFALFAQTVRRVRRIGLLMIEEYPPEQRDDLRGALAALGWVEGANLVVESRAAGGDVTRLRTLADELVTRDVELIVAAGTIASQAAKRATSRIPIVIAGSGDPVGAGLVTSLAQPGGNVTGNTTMSRDLSVKRLQVLQEILPAVTRVGILVNRSNPVFAARRDAEETACRSLGLQCIFIELTSPGELEKGIAEVRRQGGQALIVSADPLFASQTNFKHVMHAARRLGLATMVEGMDGSDGALISLGPDWNEQSRQVATFVDRILRGASQAACLSNSRLGSGWQSTCVWQRSSESRCPNRLCFAQTRSFSNGSPTIGHGVFRVNATRMLPG
jgi:putative ABC transport system substrate-binding protein